MGCSSRAEAIEPSVVGAVTLLLSIRLHDSSSEGRNPGISSTGIGEGSTDGSVLPLPDDVFISAGIGPVRKTSFSVLVGGGGMLATPENALLHPGIIGTPPGSGSNPGPRSTSPSPSDGDRPRMLESIVMLAERRTLPLMSKGDSIEFDCVDAVCIPDTSVPTHTISAPPLKLKVPVPSEAPPVLLIALNLQQCPQPQTDGSTADNLRIQ